MKFPNDSQLKYDAVESWNPSFQNYTLIGRIGNVVA